MNIKMGFTKASSAITILQVILQVITFVILAVGQPVTKLDDEYKILPGTNDSFKIHPKFQSWENANKTCNLEEASLFYTEDEAETKAVVEAWNQTLLFRWLLLDNDAKSEIELFKNVTGRPIWELYNTWNPHKQQSNFNKEQNVALLLTDGQITVNFPFICKKKLNSIVKEPSITKEVKEVATKGYKYFKDSESYYKIHTKFETWKNAKEVCIKEGAILFYPENKCECNVVLNFWNQTQFFRKIFIGVSSAKNGSFQTVNERPFWDVYSNWNPGEPNNFGHEEGCVVLMRNGTMNDEKCNLNIPFICKKKNENSAEIAACDKIETDMTQGIRLRKDYTYIEDTKNLYKIHTIPHNWEDAKEICSEEASSLFFPENECEANAILQFWKKTQPITRVFIGVSRTMKGIFETIDGRSISDVYNKWKPGEPNNSNNNENCVLLFPDGTINDNDCKTELPFICKKQVDLFVNVSTSVAVCDIPKNDTSQEKSGKIEPFMDIQEDYKLLEGTPFAFKIHPKYSTWKDANNTCVSEGASLFYPFNECEAHNVMESLKKSLLFRWIFTGSTSTLNKEMFQDVEYRPIWELYNTWHPDKLNNKSNEDGNAVLLLNEQLITNFPFVCKKTLTSNFSHVPCHKNENKIETNNEYIFINATQNYYNIHTSFKTWIDANDTCSKEDAILFYPDNNCEANAVIDIWNKTQFFRRIFIGISSTTDGIFETVDGRPDWEVYNNWQGGEPNDNNGKGCVTLARNGTLNDVNCGMNMPFICKKKPKNKTNDAVCDKPEVETQQVIVFRKDYTYLENTHSVYKIHPRPRKWQEARDICAKEGTELFFPENECEVSTVLKLWEETQPINEIYVGISSAKKGVFLTVDGRSVWDVYTKFNPGEPNNLNNKEDCLVLSRKNRSFNDDRCDVRHPFICKKKVDTSKNNILCNAAEENNTTVRKDYKYLEATGSLYKIHTIARSWLDAKDFCVTEGAALFFPENECEARAVQHLWNETQPFSKVFIGISSPNEGIFETIDGRLAKDVYNKWSTDKPSYNNNQDCVLFDKIEGTFHESRCDKIHPFICKKKIDAPKRNTPCDKSDNWNETAHQTSEYSYKDYTFLSDTNYYYKLHTTLSTWEDAKTTCASERASLFYPENECEKDAVTRFWDKTKLIPWIFIGVSSPVVAGVFETVNGVPISHVYNKWSPGEPNNADGSEGCVILRRDGTLNDEHCDKKFAFICKRHSSTNKEVLCDKRSQNEVPETKFFRKDYTYVEEVANFYKFHTTPGNWHYAKKKCSMEGAKLFYPENKTEVDAVLHFWNQTQPWPYIFIGMTDLLSKEDFETTDGRPISNVYDNWGSGEPNDANGIEDCVVLRKDGTLNDDQCTKKFPFICKKNVASLEWNDRCNMADKNYVYDEVQRKCYKFHLTPKNWMDAYTICSAELSYLAVINSQEEADLLVKITEQTPKNKTYGQYMAGVVQLGFHNPNGKGWKSLKGQSLSFTGYDKWASQQPDGGDEELCGSMFYNGELNDLGCFQKSFFICEHDIES